jgi:hypothetical protein
MNIYMADPFPRDWEWIFGHSLNQYDSLNLYSIFHDSDELGPILNARWIYSNEETHWI